MSKSWRLLLCFFLCWQGSQAQNLVPNPSFENVFTIPCYAQQTQASFTSYIHHWTQPTLGSSDIYNRVVPANCFSHPQSSSISAIGWQAPRTGDGMVGFIGYASTCPGGGYREYIQVQLTSPLIVGHIYRAEVFVSCADSVDYAHNNLGIYFSDTAVNPPNVCHPLNVTPQVVETAIITDEVNWTSVSGMFMATSPAQYLLIGNFSTNSQTSAIQIRSNNAETGYYYFDDVSVIEQPCFTHIADTAICEGDSLTLWAKSIGPVSWATSNQPNLILSADTHFKVGPQDTTTYLLYSACDTATIQVAVKAQAPVSLGNDTALCQGDSLLFDLSYPNASYLWHNLGTTSSFTVTQTGGYWVQVGLNGCSFVDSVQVNFNSMLPAAALGADTLLCPDASIVLGMPSLYAVYQWQDGASNATFTVQQAGLYWCQVTNGCGSNADSIWVDYVPDINLNLGNDTTLCMGEELSLNISAPNATFMWQDGSNLSSKMIASAGVYELTVTEGNCIWSDALAVNYLSPPVINLGADTSFCGEASLLLDATTVEGNYLWQDGQTSSTYTVTESGTYAVSVSNSCGVASDSISFNFNSCDCELFLPKAFSPNGDLLNDKIAPKSLCPFVHYHFLIIDRWGNVLFESRQPELAWDGSHKGKPAAIGVYSYYLQYRSLNNSTVERYGVISLVR